MGDLTACIVDFGLQLTFDGAGYNHVCVYKVDILLTKKCIIISMNNPNIIS